MTVLEKTMPSLVGPALVNGNSAGRYYADSHLFALPFLF